MLAPGYLVPTSNEVSAKQCSLTPTLDKSAPVTLEKSTAPLMAVRPSFPEAVSAAEIFRILFLSAFLGRSARPLAASLLPPFVVVGASAGDNLDLASSSSSSNLATFFRSNSFSLDKISTWRLASSRSSSRCCNLNWRGSDDQCSAMKSSCLRLFAYRAAS